MVDKLQATALPPAGVFLPTARTRQRPAPPYYCCLSYCLELVEMCEVGLKLGTGRGECDGVRDSVLVPRGGESDRRVGLAGWCFLWLVWLPHLISTGRPAVAERHCPHLRLGHPHRLHQEQHQVLLLRSTISPQQPRHRLLYQPIYIENKLRGQVGWCPKKITNPAFKCQIQ